jgi:hypothetical protein
MTKQQAINQILDLIQEYNIDTTEILEALKND